MQTLFETCDQNWEQKKIKLRKRNRNMNVLKNDQFVDTGTFFEIPIITLKAGENFEQKCSKQLLKNPNKI